MDESQDKKHRVLTINSGRWTNLNSEEHLAFFQWFWQKNSSDAKSYLVTIIFCYDFPYRKAAAKGYSYLCIFVSIYLELKSK